MCAICGHFPIRGKINSDDIYDMLFKMKQRWPDTRGVYLDGKMQQAQELEDIKDLLTERKIVLGHSRLSIIGFRSCDEKPTLIHNGAT
ncbi:MAG: hypothetical protein RQ824_07965 [bacterium]|nr:hypothetical protein [bacterium]